MTYGAPGSHVVKPPSAWVAPALVPCSTPFLLALLEPCLLALSRALRLALLRALVLAGREALLVDVVVARRARVEVVALVALTDVVADEVAAHAEHDGDERRADPPPRAWLSAGRWRRVGRLGIGGLGRRDLPRARRWLWLTVLVVAGNRAARVIDLPSDCLLGASPEVTVARSRSCLITRSG